MKIVITHPTCWPYTRRGTERFMDAHARYLAGRGHDVVTVATRPEQPAEPALEGGGRRLLQRPLWNPLLGRLQIQPAHMFFFTSLRTVMALDPDVVHSYFYADALAATVARRWRRHKTVFHLNGAPLPVFYRRRLPPERRMVREALRRADCLAACSRFIADLVRDEYGLDVRLVAQPFAIEEFPLGDGPPDGRPTILSVGDFTVRRKGVRCLVRAFAGVLRQHPDARLRLSGRMHDELKSELLASVPPSVSPAIEFLGLGRVEDVPRLYQQASVLALPSMWEPSGIVMMEAWASGAPVVATDHGGLPEFMGRGVGALFDPRTNGEETANADGLTQAILDGLAMSAQAGIRRRCREYAEQYTWGVWGPKFEELYRS